MFENPRRGRRAKNFTTNVPKILDLKSSSEQIFSENCRWLPLTKPLLSAKQPNLAKFEWKHRLKTSFGKWVFFCSFGILKAITRSGNTLFYAHFGSLSSRFSSSVAYLRSSHIFTHLKIFPWCTLVTWRRLRQPRSKLRYLGVTFQTLKIPVEQKRLGLYGEQQLKRTEKQFNHHHRKHYRKNAAQLGRQTFRIKSY